MGIGKNGSETIDDVIKVAQAAGLSFRASRPKPERRVSVPDFSALFVMHAWRRNPADAGFDGRDARAIHFKTRTDNIFSCAH
jgi:hypothetical protein